MNQAIENENYMQDFENLILRKTEDGLFLCSKTCHNIKAYQDNYIFGLIDALSSTYTVAKMALGEKNFLYFSFHYILETPSQNPNKDLYGESFSHFLKNRSEFDNSPIGHLAAIDWLIYQENEKLSLMAPMGSLKIWESYQNDDKDYKVKMTLEKLTRISLLRNKDGEIYLIQK